jgi:FeS assembly SUF system protein
MENILELETKIVQVLKNIFDPEIPVNIYDLGLIYGIDVNDENVVEITMTLTAPNCPVIDDMLTEIRDRVSEIDEVKGVDLNLVFDPPWGKEMMSEEALLELGFL